MFGWKRKCKRTEMDELKEKRERASRNKLEAAEKGIAILDALLVNRRIENIGPVGPERRALS